jgi:hypothetical protein
LNGREIAMAFGKLFFCRAIRVLGLILVEIPWCEYQIAFKMNCEMEDIHFAL